VAGVLFGEAIMRLFLVAAGIIIGVLICLLLPALFPASTPTNSTDSPYADDLAHIKRLLTQLLKRTESLTNRTKQIEQRLKQMGKAILDMKSEGSHKESISGRQTVKPQPKRPVKVKKDRQNKQARKIKQKWEKRLREALRLLERMSGVWGIEGEQQENLAFLVRQRARCMMEWELGQRTEEERKRLGKMLEENAARIAKELGDKEKARRFLRALGF